ncbi:putative Ig domain-containing protein [Pedococcus sp. KACC 23699]|uniref:Ig domain-containing protein n=1 Tax=Pedococcus sp. KACC 23699 TaxID=3149228 RepID=A0AAU7JWX3_9MICO
MNTARRMPSGRRLDRRAGRSRLGIGLRVALALSLASLGALALPGSPAQAAGTVLDVTTTADNAAGIGACSDPTITAVPTTLSLREATCLADNIGGTVTINVPAGNYSLCACDGLYLGRTPGQDVSIIGAGSASTVIDGLEGAPSILTVDRDGVGNIAATVRGITFTHANGGDPSGGSGITVARQWTQGSDSLSVSSSAFVDNYGGGISMHGGRLAVADSVFTGNQVTYGGSAIFYELSYAVVSPAEAVTVTGSVFSGNFAYGNRPSASFPGGTLVIRGDGATPAATVDDNTFTGNTVELTNGAVGHGAAINQQGGGVLTASRNTFTGNRALYAYQQWGAGSAISSDGTAVLRHNRISGNNGQSYSPTDYSVAVRTTGTLDAADNWWGCNTGPNSPGCDTLGGTGAVTGTAAYLQLAASASPAQVVGPNAASTITASMTTDSLGAPVSGAALSAFEGVPVTFADPPGDATVTTSPGAHTAALSSGVANIDFHSNTTAGRFNTTASLDNATATAPIEVDTAPVITSPNSARFVIGRAASHTVTTTGYPAVALSESGTLPAGLTFTDNGDGTATISGTPTGTGSYPVNLTANNGYAPNATQTLTLSVGQPPAFTSAGTARFSIGAPGSFTVTTSGVPTVSTITKSGTLPAGVTFTDNGNGTATIAGTPTGTGSTYPVTLTATNGVSPNATQSLTIQVDQAPSVTANPNDQTVQPGTSVSFSAAANGVPTPSVQWQRSTDGGASFANIVGATSTTYTFTAGPGDDGNQYRAVFTNVAGTATSTAATLRVGTAPAFTSADHTSFVVGQAGSFALTTSGLPTATLSRTAAQFPAWLTLTDNGDGSGSLRGTPPAGSGGTYTFTLKAANGFSPSASQTFTLFVDASPVITSADHTTFTAGAAGTFAVRTTAGFPTTTTITKSGALPSGVTFTDNGDGTASLTGTPGAGTGGSYPLTIRATATGGQAAPATQSFTVTVDEAPAITSADHATFSTGTPGSFTVSTAPAHPASTTVRLAGTLPSGVTFTPSGTGGVISGTPNVGSGGTYTLTLTADNGVGAGATQTFTLTVNEPARITSADHATFATGVADSFTVTTVGGQPSATTLTEAGTLPAGVSFVDNGDGTATLAGTATTSGRFPLTITASNGVLPDSTQSFTLTVTEPPTITSADHTTFAAGSAGSFTVTTTPGTPSATTLAVSGRDLPAGVRFTDHGDGTATLAGTPAADTGGTYRLIITASNGTGVSSTQGFELTVTQAPKVSSTDHTTFTVGTAGTFTVTTTAGHPTTTTLTESGTLPTGVTFTDHGDGTATLAGTPAGGTGGSYPLTITATNTAGSTNQAFTLQVTDAPNITSTDHTTFAAGSAGTFTVTTTPGTPTATTLAVSGDQLPSGVTFTDHGDGTATLGGTPAAGTGGTYALTITATNGADLSSTQNFTLTVAEAPVVTSGDRANFTVGSAGSFTVTTSGGYPSAQLSLSGALPFGVTFTDHSDGTGTLAGTPAAGTEGSYRFVVTASNGDGSTTTQQVTLDVAAAGTIGGSTPPPVTQPPVTQPPVTQPPATPPPATGTAAGTGTTPAPGTGTTPPAAAPPARTDRGVLAMTGSALDPRWATAAALAAVLAGLVLTAASKRRRAS